MSTDEQDDSGISTAERGLLICVWLTIAFVICFLAGFLISDASWFQTMRVSILKWLGTAI